MKSLRTANHTSMSLPRSRTEASRSLLLPFLALLVACAPAEDAPPPRVDPPPAAPAGLGDVPINPALSGMYCGCESTLVQGKFEFPLGPLYLPQTASGDCAWELGETLKGSGPACRGGRPAPGIHPIALIYTALPADQYRYAELGLHLASHGFVVASLPLGTHLDDALNAMADMDDLENALSEDVVLIGHSDGGDKMVKRAPEVIAVGGKVAAMVLLAPKTYLSQDYSLPDVPAFLGVHWVRDNDPATWGALEDGQRRSVFRIYDQAGIVWDDAHQLTLDKSFIFFDWGAHLNQYQVGLIAYTTSFARRHVYGDANQDAYLVRMNHIPGIGASQLPISQQFTPKNKIALANFEETQTLQPPNFKDVFVQGGYATMWPTYSDEFSPHFTGALQATLKDSVQKEISVLLDPAVDAGGMNYLSFRITQQYHPDYWPTGSPVDFDVVIETIGENGDVTASDYQTLTFPELAPAVPLNQTDDVVDATKNAMRTYVIPLDDFAIQDWSDVATVTFDFKATPGELHITLDDVELIP